MAIVGVVSTFACAAWLSPASIQRTIVAVSLFCASARYLIIDHLVPLFIGLLATAIINRGQKQRPSLPEDEQQRESPRSTAIETSMQRA